MKKTPDFHKILFGAEPSGNPEKVVNDKIYYGLDFGLSDFSIR